MITTRVRLQLLAFVIVTVLGVGYVSVRYLGAGALFGAGPYPVTLQLTESGGIFTGADVTYRGVSVGPSRRTGRRSTNCSPITDRLLTTASRSAGMGGASGLISSWASTP